MPTAFPAFSTEQLDGIRHRRARNVNE